VTSPSEAGAEAAVGLALSISSAKNAVRLRPAEIAGAAMEQNLPTRSVFRTGYNPEITIINLYLFRDSAPVAGLNFPSGQPS
jgi:hypothetical protein